MNGTGAPMLCTSAWSGFGTEVLTRMLPYQCGAETQLDFGADVFRCTIRFGGEQRR